MHKNNPDFCMLPIDWSLYMQWSRLDSLTLRQLRVFCMVARLLSYTRAAEELGCQQPTVSALVAELERITQLTLLEQWGKQLALTDEGRIFYAHVQRVLAAEDEIRRVALELRNAGTVDHAPLYVAADTTVGTYVLPLLLGLFRKLQPSVTLHLRVANRAEVRTSLLAGDADLAIAGRPPMVDGLESEPFLPNPLVVVASPSHPLAQERQISLSRLAEETFLLREVGSGTRAAVEELFEVAGLPLKIGMVLGHIEAIKQTIAAGLGVSVLSRVAVKREVQQRTLTILPVEQFPLQRRWYIARLAARPLTPSAADFITFLHEYRNHYHT
jgi:DNA-binding transcriptional LysR family regulator